MCDHPLTDAPDSLRCCRETGHEHGHVYQSEYVADRHDATEAVDS